MADNSIKKLYLLYIIEVLKNYSDADHRLTQKEIIDHIKRDYDVVVERKTVSRNITDLQDFGLEIENDHGIYLAEREFEDSELRLLIDSVLASKYIPSPNAKELIDKLTKQSTVYFKKQVKHIANLERMEHVSGQLFYTVEVLSEAVEKKRKVTFFYNRYDEKGRLTKTSETRHIVNPYQIVIANGRYYLIGNMDKYDNSTHFRVERITDIEILDEPVKAIEQVEEFRYGLDLPKHMAEHIYMFSGKSETVRLRVHKNGLNDCFDWLGTDIDVQKETEDTYLVDVKANPQAMKYWAVQFGTNVEVILPERLREETAQLVENIYSKYRK